MKMMSSHYSCGEDEEEAYSTGLMMISMIVLMVYPDGVGVYNKLFK